MSQQPTVGPSPINILLVTESELDFALLQRLLDEAENPAYVLNWTKNAYTAIESAGLESHQLYLVNHQLQNQTGLRLIQKIVALNCPAPIILLTDTPDDVAGQQALQAGATDYLDKSRLGPVLLNRAIRYTIDRKRIDQELERERNLLRTLIDHIPDRIYVKDTECRKILANLTDAKIVGRRDPQQVIGKTDFDLYPSDMAAQFWNDDQDVLQTGIPLINREEPGIDLNGNICWVLTSKVPLRDVKSKITGLIGIGRDITQRKLAEQAEREQRVLAEALRDAGIALSGTLNYERILDILLEQIERVVPYVSGNFMVIEDRLARIVRTRGYEQFGLDLSGLTFDLQHTATLNSLLETNRPVVIADTTHYPEWINIEKITHVRSWLGAPVISHNRLMGFFSLDHTEPNFYTAQHAERLWAFAAQAALALQNALLFQEVQLLATTDPVTEIYNRRYFTQVCQLEIERAIRYRRPVAMLMLDIDHFKQFNDNYGHAIGDLVLKTLAQTCRQNLREVDILCRYGGEEFAIMLPETNAAAAQEAAERLREQVATTSIQTERGLLSVRISLGVSEIKVGEQRTLDKLLDQADQALYVAKRTGRDRVVVWQQDLDETF